MIGLIIIRILIVGVANMYYYLDSGYYCETADNCFDVFYSRISLCNVKTYEYEGI
jgi:hypothetical protein